MKTMKPYPLGWKKAPVDTRDWNLRNFIPPAKEEVSIKVMHWSFIGKSLTQGYTGHCCGFGDANFLINNPINTPCTNEDGHKFYYMCKVIDGEPGNEEGSNIRSAAKVLQQIGRIKNYAFANDFETINWWLLNKGPLIVGTVWYEGMDMPDEYNVVHPIGAVRGGHCYIINGLDETYYYAQNSWGEGWGNNGAFRILIPDFIKIFTAAGDAISAVEVGTEEVKKLSILELIINFIISLFKKGE